MAMTNTQQAALYSRLADTMGQEEAEILMEQLPPSGWDNVATKDDLEILRAAFTTAIVEARAEAREGFARLERRLAYYLVAVAALIVGFGLAVWIPLMATLHEYTTSAPPPAAPAAAPAQSGHVPGNAP